MRNTKTKTILFSALLGNPGSVNGIKPGGRQRQHNLERRSCSSLNAL
jgi:hypothetical protein